MTSVAILGGGVGGLSAAHELAKRGFDVTVYEARDEFGGKARSMDVPDSAVGQRKPLPGEHGFRFFPGFYRHLDETMDEIPFHGGTVKGNLRRARAMLMARNLGNAETVAPTTFPTSFSGVARLVDFVHGITTQMGIPIHEYVFFINRILGYLMACDDRRLHEYEGLSWMDFVDGENEQKSKAYRQYLAVGMTRALVAARAEEMSARTGCAILCQLAQDMVRIDGHVDRVLNGPTSDVWIKPWVEHLQGALRVTFAEGHRVTAINCDHEKVSSVTVETAHGSTEITADYYVSAVPAEKFTTLVEGNDGLLALDPDLAGVEALTTRWMTGALYYLSEDVPWVEGHVIFLDSAWALTAISQKQFWKGLHLENYGDGTVRGILSVDISDWNTEGSNGKKAKDCTEEEILTEVWKQMEDHLNRNTDGQTKFMIDASHVVDKFLDPGITFSPETQKVVANADPLLINTPGSWVSRPEATTEIPNLFLASDFVQTNTDLATMEGANEAAKRAVNGILVATKSREKPCKIFDLDEPWLLVPVRALDQAAWDRGSRGLKGPALALVDDAGKLALDLLGLD